MLPQEETLIGVARGRCHKCQRSKRRQGKTGQAKRGKPKVKNKAGKRRNNGRSQLEAKACSPRCFLACRSSRRLAEDRVVFILTGQEAGTAPSAGAAAPSVGACARGEGLVRPIPLRACPKMATDLFELLFELLRVMISLLLLPVLLLLPLPLLLVLSTLTHAVLARGSPTARQHVEHLAHDPHDVEQLFAVDAHARGDGDTWLRHRRLSSTTSLFGTPLYCCFTLETKLSRTQCLA